VPAAEEDEMRGILSVRAAVALLGVAVCGAAALAAGVVWQRPAGAVGPAPLTGTAITVLHSGKCLNVAKASTADKAPVIQYACVGAANERWRAVPQDDGSYQLVAEHSGKCLNVAGAATGNGAPLIQYRCVGAANERWTPLDRPESVEFTLVAQHSGRCLNVAGASTANGAAVIQYDCLATARNEIWSGTPGGLADPVAAGATVALQPGAGDAISLAFVDRTGTGWYGSTFPGAASVVWQPLPTEQTLTGTPALVAAGSGVQVLARGTVGDVFGVLPPGRARWVDTGGPVAADPAVPGYGSLPVPFTVAAGRDGRIWYVRDDGVHVPFLGWRPVGATGIARSVAVAQARDGVQVFALDATGTLRTAALHADGSLGAWTLVGSGLTGQVSVLTLPGYRYAVAGRTPAGAVQVQFQQFGTGAWPGAWTTLSGVSAAGTPSLVLPDDPGGKVTIVVRDTVGQVHVTEETAQASEAFEPWTAVAAPEPVATDPTPFEFRVEGGNASWGFVARTADDETLLFTASATAAAGFERLSLPAPRR
jgi:hypothetical protein